MSETAPPLLLIIDDDRASRSMLTELLRREHYRLEFAENGEVGLEKAPQLQPDLILLDVVMPGIDGFEVCRRLRAHPQLAEVPILMLTALEDHASRLTGIEAGADDFISKPYRAAELRARVKTVVRLNRYRRLRTERERFDWVVEHAEHGYLLLNQSGSLLYANSQARNIFGLKEAHPSSPIDTLELIRRQFRLQPEEPWRSWPDLAPKETLFLVRPESSRAPAAWLEVRALTNALGESSEVLLQLRDVTGELSSQRSVWSFESLISHKLRTPLTKINFGLTILHQKAERLGPDKVKEFAQMAQTGVDQLKRELEELLRYLNTPTAIPNGHGFLLGRLEEMLSEIVAQLDLKPIVPSYEGKPSRSIFLSDRAFEIIVWELLQNSKKFHPDQQPTIDLKVSRSGDQMIFEFQDDGVSLSPEQLRNAFLPYYQGEKNYTGQTPGLGLGLSMVSSLIYEVGGECRLRNRDLGEGVVVELRVPIQRVQ